jgi:spore germination protein GerM
MPRHIRLGLVAFSLVLVLGLSYYYNLQKRINQLVHPEPEPAQPYLVDRPAYSETAPMKQVSLFFRSVTKEGMLELERRKIYSSDQVAVEAKQIVAELIAGSKEGWDAVLPPETKLREVFLTSEGLAVVDLTKEASSNHPGGISQEIASIYAVVDSLIENLPSVQQVQILVEGIEAETLAGHVDLTHPFSRDLSIVSAVTNLDRNGEAEGTSHQRDRALPAVSGINTPK